MNMFFDLKKITAVFLAALIAAPASFAQTSPAVAVQNEVEVTAPREPDDKTSSFMPEVDGTKI
jgi:hypothetical protein